MRKDPPTVGSRRVFLKVCKCFACSVLLFACTILFFRFVILVKKLISI